MNHRPRTIARQSFSGTGYVTFTLLATEGAFHELQEYLLTVAEFVDRERDAFIEGVSAAVRSAGLTDEDTERYYERHEDDFYKWDNTFPSIVLSSALMSACALFEGRLTDVVRDLEDDSAIPKAVSWSATTDTGVRRVRRYFQSNFDIWFSDFAKWNDLLDAYSIRDAFVHALGKPDLVRAANRPTLDAAIRRFAPHVSEDASGRLRIDTVFVTRVIETMRAFWQTLGDASRENAILGPAYWP